MQWPSWFRRSAATASGEADAAQSPDEPHYRVRRLEDRCVLNADGGGLNLFTFSVAENTAAGTLVGQVTAHDPTLGPAVGFQIDSGNDDGGFSIDAAGRLHVADASRLDYEAAATHALVVSATFGEAAAAQSTRLDVVVQLTDVYAPATVTLPSGGDAVLSLVDGHLHLAHGATTLFDAPWEDVSSLEVLGSAEADRLLVDYGGGDPLPAGGLTFDGGGPTAAPGDALEIVGGDFSHAVYRYTNGHDGSVTLTHLGADRTIAYRNLEPVVNTGTVADAEFILSSAADRAVLEDLGGGLLRLRSTDAAPTFEATTFSAPTSSLTIHGGDGDDVLTVGALGGSFALNVDGDAGTNTLVLDTLEPPTAAPTFRFAGFTFDQTGTPDLLTPLASGSLAGGYGATIHTSAGSTEPAEFPENPLGFDPTLSIGRLMYPALTSGTLALNLPAGDNGSALRAGFELRWSGGRTLSNQSGNDLVIFEASSNPNGPDAAMIQVHVVGGDWTQWRYESADSRGVYPSNSPAGAFATAYDLSDFGLAAGATIDAVRYVNMTATDRMAGPGLERTVGSGVLVAEGFVLPEDNGATSQVRPDPGAFASFAQYGNSTLDPDPIYFGMLHALASAGPLVGGNDVVGVTATTVTVSTDGTARPTIAYGDFNALQILTRGGQDQVSVALTAALPTGGVSIDGGDPTDADRLTLVGTSGGQSIGLSGSSASADGRTVSFTGIEKVTVDVTAAGAGDMVTVDRTFALPGNSPELRIVGGGAGQTDRLLVDLATPASSAVDQVALDDDSVTVTGGATIGHAGLAEVELRTGDGADAVRVAPSTTTTFTIAGGTPSFTSNPGDRVTFDLAGTADPLLSVTGIGAATFTSSNRAAVALVGVDSIGATSPLDATVSAAANPNLGADTFALARNGAADELSVNGALVARIDRTALDGLTIVGSADDDELTLDYTAGDPLPAGGVAFLAGGQTTADRLRLVGPNIDTVAHRYDGATIGGVTIDGSTLEYADLESVVDLLTAQHRNFAFTATGNDVLLADDGANPGRSLLTSNHGPATSFVAPQQTMRLEAGSGDDGVTLSGLDGAFAAELTLRGQAGDDRIYIDDNGAGTAGGSVDWIDFPVFIDGGGQAEDRLTVEDSSSTRSKTYSISNVNIGGTSAPAGAAVDVPGSSPAVDGVVSPGEWDDVPTAFDSGPRPAPSLQTILHYAFLEANDALPGSVVDDGTNNNLDGGLPVTPGSLEP